jgi:hypothetical protein
MPDHLCNTHRGRGTQGNNLSVCLVIFFLALTSVTDGSAADKAASNKHPLSFGQGQTIIDLQKVVWEPLKGEGIPPGVQIRDLKGVLEREQAAIGVFITLERPTKPMATEAVTAGFYEPDHFNGKYPRLQILTITELLEGKTVQYPRLGPTATFKQAERKQKDGGTMQLMML